MRILFLLILLSSQVFAQGRRVTDDERWKSIMDGRRQMLAERSRCTQHPNAVRKNIDNNIRQINADRNLRLPRFCMDMNQRRQYRNIVRNDPAYRAATLPGWERFKARHPLPPICDRIKKSTRDAMRVRTPTSMIGVRG